MSKSTRLDTTLIEKVEALENKADRIGTSKDIDSKVQSASTDINRICQRLDDVEEAAHELSFYVSLYEKSFQTSRPGTIQPRVRTALEKVDINDEELLEAAREERLADLEDDVESGEEQVEDAIDKIRNALEAKQNEWKDDLQSAKELNKIIGGDSGFQDLISKMEGFLDRTMWNPAKDPAQLGAEWNRYVRKWNENTGKHGWDRFQEEHELSDTTISELKQFTNDEPVRLSDFSLETLEEIKEVSELESALQLEVRS